MSSRDAILGRIRRSLGVTAEDPRRNATVDERLRIAPKGTIPARGQLPAEERIALFAKQVEKVKATMTRVASMQDVPAEVADYLRQHNLAAEIRVGGDAAISRLPWSRTSIEVKRGPSDGTDAVGVSHATAAVAETGTLVMTSGSDNPTTINFLPETHIVVLEAADLAGDYETIWTKIRERYGKGVMPRTVNWITGPSRSGDIEQTILLGAHGPRRLHIIVAG